MVPDSQTALALATSSDMVAFVPRRYALAFAGRDNLRLIDAGDVTPPTDVSMIWRRDRDEAATIWFRDLISACARAL